MLRFPLGGFSLSNNLRFITGSGTYTFTNGTVSASTLLVGDASNAANNAKLIFGTGSTLSATNLNLLGLGSEITAQSGSTITSTAFEIANSGKFTQNTGSTATLSSLKVTDKGQAFLSGANTISGNVIIDTEGEITAQSGSTLSAAAIKVGSASSAAGKAGKLTQNLGAIFTLTSLEALNSALITLNGTTTVGNIVIDGVLVKETAGVFTYERSTLQGSGTLTAGSSLAFKNGALGTLNNLLGTAYSIDTGKTFTIDGIYLDTPNKKAYQSEVSMNGDLTIAGATKITAGGKLTGVKKINVNSANGLEISGVRAATETLTTDLRSEIVAAGALSIGENGAGSAAIKDGGKLSGVTNVIIGGANTGSLEISGYNALATKSAELIASGDLSVGAGAAKGTLLVEKGGTFTGLQNIVLGNADVTIGAFASNTRSELKASGTLNFIGSSDALLWIKDGALFSATGAATIASEAGKKATITLGGLGGIPKLVEATLQTGKFTLGQKGEAVLNINEGGSLRTASAMLADETGAKATVNINAQSSNSGHRAWQVTGTAADITSTTFSRGDANFTASNGMVEISGGILSMGSQNGATYGKAVFSDKAELHLLGQGVFRNQGASDPLGGTGNTIGTTSFTNSATLSGWGSVIAGNQIIVDAATIAAGGRWMYDFDRKIAANKDQLEGIGKITLEDASGVDTVFRNATFITELDHTRGARLTADLVEVKGDLKMEGVFNINMSRMLDGDYLLVNTTGGVIKDFNAQNLNSLLANSTILNLNGKTLKGSRVDVEMTGAVTTYLANNDTELRLKIYETKGNLYTTWTGLAAGSIWNMAENNFQSIGGSPLNTQKFLDGDIVTFNSTGFTGNRVVNVTQDTKYGGNVQLAEVRVVGSAGDPNFEWRGGSIIAKDSALYSTIDLWNTPNTSPSGKFVKTGTSTLEIYNSNEFYGGIHLGDSTTLGGTIKVFNNNAFGTYSSIDGYFNKGVVYVHNDSTLSLGSGIQLSNRFVVDQFKTLNVEFSGTFTIQGNDATNDAENAAGGVNGGKGGGVYIGSNGNILYTGTDTLFIKNNKAKFGGGFYAEEGYTLKVPLSVTKNYASNHGGGIYSLDKFALKDGSEISGNAAAKMGGGMYVDYKAGAGAFTLHGNTTITGNLAGGEKGGGIYVEGGRTVNLETEKGSDVNGALFKGGDIWFNDNWTGVKFDPNDPTNINAIVKTDGKRNALHLAWNPASTGVKGAILNISGPYNTYFYDPITGDTGTNININGVAATGLNNDHSLPNTQTGTAIFRDDSEFYGNTIISTNGGFRLEKGNAGGAIDLIYGRKGSSALPTERPLANTFSLTSGATFSGQGKVAADNISLAGILNLDTGVFSQPNGRDGSGGLTALEKSTQGKLSLEGNVSFADSAKWLLNLTNDLKTDLINVTGGTAFTGTTTGQKLSLQIDNLLRGQYTILTSSTNITGFNADKTLSDAKIFSDAANLINIGKSGLNNTDHANLGRIRANTWVDNSGATKNLYMEIIGRNRHIQSSAGGNWGFNTAWTFNPDYTTNLATLVTGTNWSAADSGPTTNVYLDGDMVSLKGGTYQLTSHVKAMDIFVSGSTLTRIDSGASVFNITGSVTATESTITTDPLKNDYGIAGYTGKLYKYDAATLEIANKGANTFYGGIDIGTASVDGGTISFTNGNQLGVGSGKVIHFVGSGTLKNETTTSTTLASAIKINSGKTATIDTTTKDLILSGVISDLGAMTKNSSGKLILSGANTFSGGTTWNDGTIQISNNAALGAYAAANGTAGYVTLTGATIKNLLLNNATHTIQNHFDVLAANTGATNFTVDTAGKVLTVNNVNIGNAADGGALNFAAGSGAFTASGAGSYVFSNNQARSGGAIYSASNSALNFNSATSFTSNKALAGSGGAIYLAGNSALSFTGATSFTGNQALAGSGGAVYAKNISLTNTVASELLISGNTATDKGGAFYVMDNGAFALNATAGDIKFSGNTAAANSGAAIWLGSSATLNLNTGAKNIIFADSLGSAGSNTLTKTGTGTLTFAGTNAHNFSGTSNVNAGEFRLTNGATFGVASQGSFTLAANTNFSGGGTLKANAINILGTINIDKSAVTSGAIAAADKVGTLTFDGNTTIYGGTKASISFDLNQTAPSPTMLTRGYSDLLEVKNGNLTLDDALNRITFNFNNFRLGYYKLIDVTGSGLLISSGNIDAVLSDATIHGDKKTNRHRLTLVRGNESITDGIGTVYNLAAEAGSNASNQLWLGAEYNNLKMYWTGVEDSVWQTSVTESKTNWLDKAATNPDAEKHVENYDLVVFQDSAVFGGATPINKSIMLESNVMIANMEVNTAATYTFGGSFSITSSSIFAGTKVAGYSNGTTQQKLEKSGSGTLAFTNTQDNLFAGGIDLSAGTISFTRGGHLGTGTASINFLNSATLQAAATGQTLANKILIANAQTATIDTQANTLTISGLISDGANTGNLTKSGTGTLILSNATNDFDGVLTVSGGILQANGVGALGNSSGIAVATGARAIVNDNADVTLSKVISGLGAFEKTGSGILTLTGTNTHSGGTYLTTGKLLVENVSALGTGLASLASGTVLEINSSSANTYGYQITGAGKLEKKGTGTLTLSSATSNYAGGTQIFAGTLQVTNANALGATASGVIINSGATLESALTTAGTLSQVISGAGQLTKTSASNLTLSGANTYSGGTTLTAGKLIAKNVNALGSGLVSLNASTILEMNFVSGTNTFIRQITGAGAFEKSGAGTLALNNTGNDFTGAITVSAGVLQANGVATLGGSSGANSIALSSGRLIVNNSADETLSKAISGAGVFEKTGAGILTLATANTYTGGTFVTTGRLKVQNVGALGTGVTSIASGAVLDMNLASAGTYAQKITGAGKLEKTGAETLTLSASNSDYSGGTEIVAGTLKITDANALGATASGIVIDSGATLESALATAGTLTQVISGAGQLTKTSASNLTLSGDNFYSGGTYLSNGRLIAQHVNALGSGTVSLATSTILEMNFASGTNTFAQKITGAGAFEKTGAGTLALSNTGNDFTGAITVSTGVLQANGVATLGGSSGANSIAISTGARAIINNSATETLAKLISGAGVFEKAGSGTLTLSNTANALTGEINVSAGILQANSLSVLGANTASNEIVLSGGRLLVNNSTTETLNKLISGTSIFEKAGTDVLRLSNVNTYSGGTTISGGTLQLLNVGSAGTGTISVGTDASLDVANTVAASFANVVSGAGKLIKSTSADLTVTGANTFTGGTFLNSNKLILGSNDALGVYTYDASALNKGQVFLAANTTLDSGSTDRAIQNRINSDTTTGATLLANAQFTLQNVNASGLNTGGAIRIADNSQLTMNAALGDFVFSGNRDYGGANDVALGTGANLVLTGAQNSFFNSGVRGGSNTSSITKSGAGFVQIGADSAFAGISAIDAGTLRVITNKTFGTGAAGNTLTLASAATLAGGGVFKAATLTINGTLAADSANFSSGSTDFVGTNNLGTLTLTGNTTLGASSHIKYDADAAVAVSLDASTFTGTTGDLIKFTGGTYTITKGAHVDFVSGSLNTGKYLIFKADSAINLSGGTALNGIGQANGSEGVLESNLTTTSGSPRGHLFFDWGRTAVNAPIDTQIWLNVAHNTLNMDWQGGDGTWVSGSGTAPWQSKQVEGSVRETSFSNGDYATFNQTAASVITVDSTNVLVSGMDVSAAGNTTFNGTGAISAKITDASIEGHYLSGTGAWGNPLITPDGKLQKSGAGVLSFENTGANNFAGGIYLSGGTLAFNQANQLGALNGSVDQGINFTTSSTLQANAGNLSVGNKVIVSSGQTATINTQANALTMSGVISGTGILAKSGTGSLVLNNAANSYSGQTQVLGGTLESTGIASVGGSSDIAISSGANFALNIASGTSDFAKVMSGAGAFEKRGAGTLTLSAANTYSGASVVSAGKLKVANVAAINGANTAQITVNTGATLEIANTTSEILAKQVSGVGSFIKSGAGGTLTLSSATTDFTGSFTVQDGVSGSESRLLAQNISALGSGTSALNLSGAYDSLEINQTSAADLSRLISGAGYLVKSGADNLTLSAANSFSGGTKLNVGTITLGNDSALGTGQVNLALNTVLESGSAARALQNHVEITDNATLRANNLFTIGKSNLANSSSVNVVAGKTLNLNANTGDFIFAANTGANSQAILLGNGSTLNVSGAGNSFVNNVILGGTNSQLTKSAGSGAGILQIAANSAVTASTIDAGTLRVVEGKTFGNADTSTFDLGAQGILAGNGTVKADTININGKIAADNATLSSGNTTIAADKENGTLTLTGDTINLNSTAEIRYSIGTPVPQNDSVYGFTGTTGDLVQFSGNGIYTITEGAKIHFEGSLASGKYLIMQADQDFVLDCTTLACSAADPNTNGQLDGIGGVPGVLKSNVGLAGGTPRGELIFDWGRDASNQALKTQIWLSSTHNALKMDWTTVGNATWRSQSSDTNWKSVQSNTSAGTLVYEHSFRNGDYVNFGADANGNRTITLADGVIVSGMDYSATGTTIFEGTGSINSVLIDAGIGGNYVDSGCHTNFTNCFAADGKLQKSGSGTLIFANSGSNNFAGGIHLSGGVLAFDATRQIGTIGQAGTAQAGIDQGINFVDNATLRDDLVGGSTTLSSLINISAGKTATFGVSDAAHTLTLASKISGTNVGLGKSGAGTLILSNTANDFSGALTISEGVLQANGAAALGANAAANTIAIAGSGGRLIVNNSAAETLNKTISGAGIFEKTGAGNLTLTGNNSTLTGGSFITNGKLIAQNVNALGTGEASLAANTVLEMNLVSGTNSFAQKITGAGAFEKTGLGDLSLSSSTSDYSGGTKVLGGKLEITNVNSVGSGNVAMANSSTFAINTSTSGTFGNAISGAGKLVLDSTGTLSLGGTNTFTGGTWLNSGTLQLTGNQALGVYAPSVSAPENGTLYMGDHTTLETGTNANVSQTRVVIDQSFSATLIANRNFTLNNVHASGSNGGAISVGDGATLNLKATGGDFIFANNQQSAGLANDIKLGTSSHLNLSGDNNFFFGGGVQSSGDFAKTGTGFAQFAQDSSFVGDLTLNDGDVRITSGNTFSLVGATDTVTVGSNGTLGGGGTISANSFVIGGSLSADSAVFSSGNTAPNTNNTFGALTLSGQSVVLNDATFIYDLGTAVSLNSDDTPNFIPTQKTGDLFKISNSTNISLTNSQFNFKGSLDKGSYLLVDANSSINLGGGTLSNQLSASYNGNLLTHTLSPRGLLFDWQFNTHEAVNSQIWLSITGRNSLTMKWDDQTTSWTRDQDWTSVQNDGGREHVFYDGDYVTFDATANKIVTITDHVLVSGQKVDVDNGQTLTFDGQGGILSTKADAAITGKYLSDTWVDPTEKLTPDGKLTKTGDGTLSFKNSGNNFEEGIFIHEGTLEFSNGNQLRAIKGSVDSGIHFVDDATLKSSVTGQTLGTNILIAHEKTATFQTDLGNKLTLTGAISGESASAVANLLKTGQGELVLQGTSNNWNGTTTIDEGDLTLSGGSLNGAIIGLDNGKAKKMSITNGGVFTGLIDPIDVWLDNGGVWQLTSYTGLTNSISNLDLQNGGTLRFMPEAGEFNHLEISGKLSGDGHIWMNTNLAAGKSDTIEAVETDGNMTLHIVNSGGAPTTPGGALKLIEIKDGDLTKSNATFKLDGEHVDAGAYRYSLQKGGSFATAVDSDWYLFNTGVLSNFSKQGIAMASVAKYATVASLNDVHKRLGELRLDDKAGNDLWMRSFVKDYDNNLNPDSAGKQRVSGFDIGMDRRFETDSGTFYVGGLVGQGSSNFKGDNGGGKMDSKHVQAGAYMSYAAQNGFYLDLVGRYFWFKRDFVFEPQNAEAEKGHAKNTAYSLDAEAGFRFDLNKGWFIEPQAEITLLKSAEMDFTTEQNTRVKFAKGSNLLARTGLAVGRTIKDEAGKMQFLARIDREGFLNSSNNVTVDKTTLQADKEKSTWKFALGAQVARKNTQFHLEVETGLGKADVKQNWGINLGARLAF